MQNIQENHEVPDTLEEQERENGNVEVQWKNTKKCVLDTMSDLVENVDREARQAWISKVVINKMNEQRKLQNVNNEEGMNNYRTLRNELHRAKDKAKKEYFLTACVMR